MKLPSSRIIALLIISASIIVSVFLIRTKEEPTPRILAEADKIKITGIARESFETLDTDGDGLLDWEEAFWKTDPRNPDTDGDGTNDGDEVREGRNPLVAGPGDTLEAYPHERINISSFNNSIPASLSETDKVARELLSDYLSAKKNGREIDALTQEQLIDQILWESKSVQQQAKVFTQEDIALRGDTLNDIRAYGGEVRNIIRTNLRDLENELVIFDMSISQENELLIRDLNKNVAAYADSISKIQNIKTPPSAVHIQLLILNAFSTLHDAVQKMSSTHSDPILALNGLNTYIDNAGVLYNAINEANNFFLNKGIIFEE